MRWLKLLLSGIMDNAFLDARIAKTKLLIEAYEDASLAISTDSIEAYMLDTGQTIQRITKLNIELLEKAINGLYNRLATLEARRYGSGVVIGTPQW